MYELTRWFVAFSELFLPQVLSLPVIDIESAKPRGRRHAKLGHYAHDSWLKGSRRHGEIVIVAEYLDRPVEAIAETLLHEMVHHANQLAGVRDWSGNNYHNKHFKSRAESVGLEVAEYPPFGWAKTSLTPPLERFVAAMEPRADAFTLFRTGAPPLGSGSTPRGRGKAKLAKWACDCSSLWGAAGQAFEIDCRKCGRPLDRC